MTAPGDRAVVVLVHGTVQGVGFRWWTRRRLAALRLDGTAENLPDGAVRVTARGPAPRVDRLVDDLRGGGTPGHVTRVDVTDARDGRVTP